MQSRLKVEIGIVKIEKKRRKHVRRLERMETF
jgi:hypothetical protein